MENVLLQDPVARLRLFGPRCFSSNTPFNDTGKEHSLTSTTQIAVLTSDFSDQQVLLKIASSLIEIFCASMLKENALVCLDFRAVVVVVVVVPERAKCFLPKFRQVQPIGYYFFRHWAFDPYYCACQVART